MKGIVSLIFFCAWMAGIVIANGFWSTFFALFIPFWAYYVVIEKLLVEYVRPKRNRFPGRRP